MLFGREHVAEANSHYRSAAQFGLREVGAARSIDLLHDLAVQIVEFFFGGGNETKTHHAHADRSGELESTPKAFASPDYFGVVALDPAGEQVCKADLFAQARNNPS